MNPCLTLLLCLFNVVDVVVLFIWGKRCETFVGFEVDFETLPSHCFLTKLRFEELNIYLIASIMVTVWSNEERKSLTNFKKFDIFQSAWVSKWVSTDYPRVESAEQVFPNAYCRMPVCKKLRRENAEKALLFLGESVVWTLFNLGSRWFSLNRGFTKDYNSFFL